MRLPLTRSALLLGLLLQAQPLLAACKTDIDVKWSLESHIEADAQHEQRRLAPSFFGFNLEWLEFQSALWDSSKNGVRPEVIALMQAFPGAVYRFPGGHNSNHLDWKDAVNPQSDRPRKKQVPWMDPVVVRFGPQEYLDFVRQVHGTPWYVANLYGELGKVHSAGEMASGMGKLSAYLEELKRQGYPATTYWELGNELDRADYRWPPQKLAETAQAVAAEIKRQSPGARFVHLQEEYAAQSDKGYTAERYNKIVRDGLANLKPDYAMHFYYDGPPNAPAVSYFLGQLCQVVDASQSEGHSTSIWISEHGRAPVGAWTQADWKASWPQSADLQAAISEADMTIALANVPQVSGAFVHALHASGGPWPLLHARKDGHIEPSVTLLGLRLLRESMLPVVLNASQGARGDSQLGNNPQTRALIMTDEARKQFSLWVVNRTATPRTLAVEISHAGKLRASGNRTLSQSDPRSNNYVSQQVQIQEGILDITPQGNGKWAVVLPAYSVSSVRFQ